MNAQVNPTIIATNTTPYLENRYKRIWATFVYLPTGESYYILEGKKLTVDEFDSLYPVIKLETINE